MSKIFKLSMLAIVLAVLFVVITTGSVYADDETPVEAPPVENMLTGDEMPAVEPPPAEGAAVEAAPLAEDPPAEAPVEEATAEEPPAAEQPLSEVPDEALVEAILVEAVAEEPPAEPVTLVDESGAPLTLATEETAELLKSGDPYITIGTTRYAWVTNYPGGCPASTATYFVVCNPTTTTTAITDVLAFINTGMVPTDKKIYVENGIYTQDVLIDGTASAYHKLLTGLIGVDGSAVTTLNGDVMVKGVTGGFTLSGFRINGKITNSDVAVMFKDNIGTITLSDLDVLDNNSAGIVIQNQSGGVVLNNVDSSGNDYLGAYIGNSAGVYPVTVTNSSFNGNDPTYDNNTLDNGYGLVIESKGTVTLTNVSANENSTHGVVVSMGGAVTLTDVDASGNGWLGGLIRNDGGVYPVTVTNAAFDDNDRGFDNDDYGYGLMITSKGAVTLNGVSASRNNTHGGLITTNGIVKVTNGSFMNNDQLKNTDSNGLDIRVNSAAAVTLENVQAANNGAEGILIGSGGAVTARNVIAFLNRTFGMLTTNAGALWPTTVSIYDSSFPVNNSNGLFIQAKGNVLLSGLYNMNGNGGNGALINTCLESGDRCTGIGTVTLVNPALTLSEFSWNSSNGLVIYAAGAVTLTGVSASGNGLNGVDIWNNYFGKTGGVTINSLPFVPSDTARSVFDDNGQHGINILSNGPVAIYGNADYTLRANGNGSSGICIACGSDENLPTTVTLRGIDLENNHAGGVKVHSRGTITLNNVWVNNPWGTHMWTPSEGILLYNNYGTGGVTLTDAGVSYTGGTGVEIKSKGAVTLTRVRTFRTGKYGVFVNNELYSGAVTLTDVTAEQPHETGIRIKSKGNVTLSGVNAFVNGGTNFVNGSEHIVGTLSESTWFKFNAIKDDVLNITITLTGYTGGGILELFNASNGERIGVDDSPSSGSFNISSPAPGLKAPATGDYFIFFTAWMDDPVNYNYQLYVTFNGVAPAGTNTLSGFDGIEIKNDYGPGSVSVTGSTANPHPWVSDNTGSGLTVSSLGNITVRDASLHRNGGYGVYLGNNAATTAKSITISNLDVYRSGSDGLVLDSIGAVTMTNIAANENKGTGLYVNNCWFVADRCRGTAGVSLLATSGRENNISNNGSSGVSIYTVGLVKLNNLNIQNNASRGLSIDGPGLAAPYLPLVSGVTLTSVGNYWNRVVSNNTTGDIYAFRIYNTYGAVSLANLEVSWNHQRGLTIGVVTAHPVTLTNVDVNNNGSYGITISAKGAVTLNGSAASSNGDDGVTINTQGDVTIATPAGSQRWWYNGNTGWGISVDTKGAIKFSGLDVSGNERHGIYAHSSGAGKLSTLANLEVHLNGIYTQDNGINLEVRGPVIMTNLHVTENRGTGVNVDNCDALYIDPGYKCQGGGAVTLNATTGQENYIADNGGYGLKINSIGLVTLSNFHIENHPMDGVYIDAPYYAAAPYPVGGVTITSTGGYENRVHNNLEDGARGLTIVTYGPVSITRLSVFDTHNASIFINNSIAAAPQPVTLTDVNTWHAHDYAGIYIESRGNVTLYGVSSSQNIDGYNWLELGDNVGSDTDRQFAVGEIYFDFDATEAGDVDINFHAPDFQGEIRLFDPSGALRSQVPTMYAGELLQLYYDVQSGQEGTYTLVVTPYDDRAYYYYLETMGGTGSTPHYYNPINGIYIYNAYSGATGNVTIAKSTANPHPGLYGNSGDALNITTNGALSISDLGVHQNGGSGIHAELNTAGKTATLARVDVNSPHLDGVWLDTKGAVTLTDVDIRRTQGDGLYVYARGAITLTRVHSNYSETHAGKLMNYHPGVTAGVTITDSEFSFSQHGLTVSSNGLVKLLGVGVEGNFLQQASINSSDISGGATVNGFFPGIDRWDEDIYIRDTRWNFEVTPDMESAGFDLGVVLHPYGAPMRVMLFSAGGERLEFGSTTSGEIYAWEGETWVLGYDNIPQGHYYLMVRAGTNYEGDHFWGDKGTYELVIGGGATIYNYKNSTGALVATIGGVTVDRGVQNSSSWFIGNDAHGLQINGNSPSGNVLIANSEIFGNTYYGLSVENYGYGKTTTLNKVNLGGNGQYNVYINSLGPVSWTGGDSAWSGFGSYINNSNFDTPYTPYPVTISGVNFHDTQESDGLRIFSYGNVSLTSVGAWENTGIGILIDNCRNTGSACPGSGTVAVNNSNGSAFHDNDSSGLYINSRGGVTLTNIESTNNDSMGISVDNYQIGYGSGAVTLTYTLDRNVSGNGDVGIQVRSRGAITLTSVKHLRVTDNCQYSYCSGGIALINDNAPVAAPVSVQGTLLNSIVTGWNNGRGLVVSSKGAVTVKNVNAYSNQYEGITIGNVFNHPNWPASVTLTSVVAQYNGQGGDGTGVAIYPAGAVNIFGLDSSYNQGDGLYVYASGFTAPVTIKKSFFRENHNGGNGDGMDIQTTGNVVLDSIYAASNDKGVRVNTAGGTITMLGTYYKNMILGHWGGTSLDAQATGTISLAKLDVKDSGDSYVQSSVGGVSLNTVNIMNNASTFWVVSNAGAAFTKVVSLNNGSAGYADGIKVTLNGGLATFTDSMFSGNTGHGIDIDYNYDPGPILPRPTLIRTMYFGNDTDNTFDADLYVHY